MAGIPAQRWLFHPVDKLAAQSLAEAVGISPVLAQILLNRGLSSPAAVQQYLQPDPAHLPPPSRDFADLPLAVDLLDGAIRRQEPIAICGDYDADGMTSTALLLRALRGTPSGCGAPVHYRIPSRMTEGYGLNSRMVQELHREGVRLILTVDNGISAHEPIQLAKALGLTVIVTDHHDLPPQLPPADAILNPKQLPVSSPYRGMAGVGVAYLLAQALAERRGDDHLQRVALELFTVGTIADLAPLTGVNRLWVRQGLNLLPTSQVAGIRALLQVMGVQGSLEGLRPEWIGFGLGPRINAVGRIGRARMGIQLLTTDDPLQAEKLARRCERLNQVRQQMCGRIEAEALEQIAQQGWNLQQERVLTILGSPQQRWHKGVIGIVASRLAERFGCPVFIGSQSRQGEISGSARQGIPEFDVFQALEFCKDLFHKHGGHPAAGGFSLKAENWPLLEKRLRQFAQQQLQPEQIQPLVQIDAEVSLSDLTLDLYRELQHLQPCGIGNPEPVFYSRNLQVLQQQRFGPVPGHLKLLLRDPVLPTRHFHVLRATRTESSCPGRSNSAAKIPSDGRGVVSITDTLVGSSNAKPQRPLWAIRWRGAEIHPLPERVDVAYTLKAKTWQGETQLELEIVGIRPAQEAVAGNPHLEKTGLRTPDASESPISSSPPDAASSMLNSKPSTGSQSRTEPSLLLICRPTPQPTQPLRWQAVDRFSVLLPQAQGTILFYGFRRPSLALSSRPTARYRERRHLTLHYDRPQAGHCYDQLWLWSWPPSLDHLKWLLCCTPSSELLIAVHQQAVPLPSATGLQRQLRQYLQTHSQVDLLRLAQQWWLSPAVLVAGLRSLGYACPDFGPTGSLGEELEAQQAWYSSSWQRVAALLQGSHLDSAAADSSPASGAAHYGD
ncbi:MAG TPA: single-stranded-DNA-specific exonuclease RecJ [Synechococcus sp. M44_DOE_062]|nr:single-stranded-DNA-specific exonuclease RecJ [Synechococcus sp. M44_DOE_062]